MELKSDFIRNGALGPIRDWKLKECIAIHKLLETVLIDHAAASSKRKRSLATNECILFIYLFRTDSQCAMPLSKFQRWSNMKEFIVLLIVLYVN